MTPEEMFFSTILFFIISVGCGFFESIFPHRKNAIFVIKAVGILVRVLEGILAATLIALLLKIMYYIIL